MALSHLLKKWGILVKGTTGHHQPKCLSLQFVLRSRTARRVPPVVWKRGGPSERERRKGTVNERRVVAPKLTLFRPPPP